MGGITYYLRLIARVFILVVLLSSTIEAKAIAKNKSPAETKLFFQHNNTLVQITVRNHDQIEKTILINDVVTDYDVDELNDRIFWIAKNGSIFAKSLITPKLPDEPIFDVRHADAKIAYDMVTDKLYFSNELQHIVALDLSKDNQRSGLSTHRKWHVVTANVTDAPWAHDKPKIKKIVLDPSMGSMFVFLNDSDKTDVYRYNMDGTDKTLIISKSPYDFEYDFGSKEFHEDGHVFTIDESQLYWVYYTDDRSYKVIKTRGPKTQSRPFAFLDAFDVDDIKNLKLYRKSVKKHEFANPCKNNGDCGSHAMCLLKVLWPRKSCSHYRKIETHGRLPRQIPFDMYHQQPTLRPEPQPTQPDNPYLPVYLSIIGK